MQEYLQGLNLWLLVYKFFRVLHGLYGFYEVFIAFFKACVLDRREVSRRDRGCRGLARGLSGFHCSGLGGSASLALGAHVPKGVLKGVL